jgi:hypothetical protein
VNGQMEPGAGSLLTGIAESDQRRLFWANVAAFGALWGTVEITLGSFLHSLRVPLTGEVLASIGAGLLVSQRQILPRRGVTLATGAVACICKSVSPGGVILGPMVGIFFEAVLVELALLAWPRSRFGAMLAGFLAAAWALSQKVFTQVVIYGADLLRLYLAMLRETAKGLGIPSTVGWLVGASVVGAVFAVGATFGLAGRQAGRAAVRGLAGDERGDESAAIVAAMLTETGNEVGRQSRSERQRTGRRWPMAVLALACVAGQVGGNVLYAAISLALWMAVLGIVDRFALRRLWMPRFWAFTLFIGLASGLLLGKRETPVLGIPLSLAGLQAGLLMAMRGAFVLGLATWASRAVCQSDVERVLGRAGAAPLGTAIATAFSLLPALKVRIGALRETRKGAEQARPGARSLLERLRSAWDLSVALVTETARLAAVLAANTGEAVRVDGGQGTRGTAR